MRSVLGNVRSNLKADTTAGMPLGVLLSLQTVLVVAVLVWLVMGSAGASALMELAFAGFLAIAVVPMTVVSVMSLCGAAREPHLDFV